ncbi:telomeric repeat-binding factor 2-interacting protein 1 isoform X1 [Pseudophryne corroboree]|uniref:telomeric repeat-binding factor 2-interacting protein 1 isoform X1 n=1 Tax=Pseudophryne corroboree TaxID=495146 RepID=UPI003081344C
MSDDKRTVLQIAIQSLLDSAVLIPVPVHQQGQGYYSSLFVVPKPDGSVRPILNLKGLNQYVTYYRFKMESLWSVIAGLEPQEFMIALDLKDAYLHIPIWPPHQSFLRFAIRQNHYQFQALPFGLSSAPRVFTKVMSVMIAHLRSLGVIIVPYLDDLLIKAPSQQMLLQHALLTYNVLVRYGWILNFKKSHLIPSQRLQFLGMILDTVDQRIYLPEQKVQRIRHLVQLVLKPRTVSVHLCIRLLGTIASVRKISLTSFSTGCARTVVGLASTDSPDGAVVSTGQSISTLVAQSTQSNRRETVRRLELDNSNDGRESQRLGSCSSKLSAPGSLGGSRKIVVYNCPGTPGNLQCATTSSAYAPVSDCPGAVRQRDGGRVHQTRRNEKPHGNAGSSSNPQLGRVSPSDVVGSVHSGSGQLGG